MTKHSASGVELAELLGAVENAAPVAAADVVAAQLADALGATEVAFLIADFSGHALIRLGRRATARPRVGEVTTRPSVWR